ncbi:hypothetical protein AXG93_2528s1080 [Marchantia polymorpha subsp. ruderalis]|uniref:Uncharacterized protein n=1 Tax=Marchantia polymorpha subsp. ruderalis TaxID=1480154 RepID=A0A176WQC6_MARPO|nr:hypothetical protein AXG93_2528s1080 [Marchantia polymorpha subsp. ruderalis]
MMSLESPSRIPHESTLQDSSSRHKLMDIFPLNSNDDDLSAELLVDWRGRPSQKSSSGMWRASSFIFGITGLEFCAFFGVALNMVPYMMSTMRFKQADAANTYTNFAGTSYLLSLFTAFIADTYWGRFWTIVVFGFVEFLGMLLFALSASVKELKPEPCTITDSGKLCPQVSKLSLAVLYLVLYLVALGSAGIRPNLPSHGADQFSPKDPKEKNAMSRFFNWYFFSICAGALVGVGALVYIDDSIGNKVGFAISAGVMLAGVLCFATGAPFFRNKLPDGSPLTRIAEVLVASLRNRSLALPDNDDDFYEVASKAGTGALNSQTKLPRSTQLMFLNKAAIRRASKAGAGMESDEEEAAQPSRWRLCTLTQVEETKAVIKLLPIWAPFIVLNTCVAQLQTFSIAQGVTMDRTIGSFKFSAPTLVVIPATSLMIMVPLYERVFVSQMRKITGNPQGVTLLQRMGVGLFVSIVSMGIAAMVERRRIRIASEHGLLNMVDSTVPYSIFWLLPQYLVFGLADLFAFTGSLEFFYTQAPDSMRSLSSALSFGSMSFGFFFSTILVELVNKITAHGSQPGWIAEQINHSKLYNFYWLLAGLSVVNFLVYVKCAQWFQYKEVACEPRDPELDRSFDDEARSR